MLERLEAQQKHNQLKLSNGFVEDVDLVLSSAMEIFPD
jgi:hypothetical protein